MDTLGVTLRHQLRGSQLKAKRDQQGTQAPQTDDEHVTSVKHRAQETRLYPKP
jgi:hypothetical protein